MSITIDLGICNHSRSLSWFKVRRYYSGGEFAAEGWQSARVEAHNAEEAIADVREADKKSAAAWSGAGSHSTYSARVEAPAWSDALQAAGVDPSGLRAESAWATVGDLSKAVAIFRIRRGDPAFAVMA